VRQFFQLDSLFGCPKAYFLGQFWDIPPQN